MMFHWGEYEGRLAGYWRLDSFLGERDHRAFFVGQNEALNVTALVQLVEPDHPGAAALRASWDRAMKLQHPHVMRVFETGETDLDGDRALYAVMELPDDDVSEILEKRTLTSDEARLVATGAAEGLAYLHEHRMAPRAVRPQNIFLEKGRAVLSADTITPGLEADRRRDMRELGATLVQAITGLFSPAAIDEAGTRERLAEFGGPFREIAQGCLRRDWTPADVLDALAGRPAPPATLPPAPAAERAPRRWPLAVGVVIVAAVLLLYATRSRSHEQEAATPPAPPKKAAIVTNPAPAQVAPKAVSPAVKRPAPARVEEPPAEADRIAPKSSENGPFAVIAATYNSFSGAARRAEQMQKKMPKLRPRVFPPKNEGKQYYVVLGTGLSQEAAERLRRLARQLGAPRDTYVTKLAES